MPAARAIVYQKGKLKLYFRNVCLYGKFVIILGKPQAKVKGEFVFFAKDREGELLIPH